VTGSSSGIGLQMTKKLLAMDYHVIMACRNKEKTLQVLKSIQEETGKDHVEFMQLDLASFESVRRFVKEFHDKKYGLHLLILNAGISRGTTAEIEITDDGFESTFQTNHLGHFLLTNLLLDDLKNSSPSRVIVVSSRTHIPGKGSGPPVNFVWTRDEINRPNGFHGFVAYKNSKLANVWFGYELARRLQKDGVNVTCNVVCPGLVPMTNLFQNATYWVQFFMRWVLYWFPFSRTEDQAAENIVHVATSSKWDNVTGKFLADKTELQSSDESYDVKKAKTLWELSEAWTQSTNKD